MGAPAQTGFVAAKQREHSLGVHIGRLVNWIGENAVEVEKIRVVFLAAMALERTRRLRTRNWRAKEMEQQKQGEGLLLGSVLRKGHRLWRTDGKGLLTFWQQRAAGKRAASDG